MSSSQTQPKKRRHFATERLRERWLAQMGIESESEYVSDVSDEEEEEEEVQAVQSVQSSTNRKKRAKKQPKQPSTASTSSTASTPSTAYPPPDYKVVTVDGVKKRECQWEDENGMVCGKLTGNTKQCIEQHWRTHTGERPYVCNECDKAFAQSAHLKIHIRVHKGEKPYPCSNCAMAFAQSSQLKVHMRTHNGERPFACPECDKAFTQSVHLQQHIRVHTGSKPYTCPECDKAFTVLCNLKTHMRTHSGSRPYPCSRCDKAFSNSGNLKKHMRTHTGSRPYKCTLCDYKASEQGSIKNHLAFKHGIGVRWHYCPQEGCDYKCKLRNTIKVHLAGIHDIGVVWHECDVGKCTFKSKHSSHLSKHIESQHNTEFIQRKKMQEERVRKALIDLGGYKEFFATEGIPPLGHFKREKRIDFRCANVQSNTQYCRIDFVITTFTGELVFLEVDEHQHQFGYDASVSCDMKRMAFVMESLSIELGDALPYIYWLRYNPHAWHTDGVVSPRIEKAEREKRLIRWLKEFESTQPLEIGYAFYDQDSDGNLDVLQNPEYNSQFAEAVTNLRDLCSREEEGEEEEGEEEEECEECEEEDSE